MSPELEAALRALRSPMAALLPADIRQALAGLVNLVARLEARIQQLEVINGSGSRGDRQG